jgi:putative transcription factor
LNCEICGREIIGKKYEKIVEGVKMILCEKCASHGESYFQPIASSKLTKPVRLKTIVKPKPSVNKEYLELEVIPDYYKIVKSAREKTGLTQEEFAKMLKEKLSVIQKIETGKIIPDINLAKRIEHLLKIKLLTPAQKEERNYKAAVKKPSLTLGDLAKIKHKSKE